MTTEVDTYNKTTGLLSTLTDGLGMDTKHIQAGIDFVTDAQRPLLGSADEKLTPEQHSLLFALDWLEDILIAIAECKEG